MSIVKTHKVRLVTNNAESTALARHLGYARFSYNHALADFKAGLDVGEWRGDRTLRPRFNAQKRTLAPWSVDLSQNASKYAIIELGQAIASFGAYRKAVAAGKKVRHVGFPRFRKRTSSSGFRADNGPGTVRMDGKTIRLPKIGPLRTREPLRFTGDVREVTVKREAGRWFACVTVNTSESAPTQRNGDAVGVDVGIKSLAVCSDGAVYENPKALRKAQGRLRRLDRAIARSNTHGRNRHSNRRERKYRLREAAHARIVNIRNDAHHKAASAITAKPVGKVVVENLNVSGMLRNRRLARALAGASLAGFIDKLEYRCWWNGITFEKVDRWFPSTKTCSECGAVRPNMALSERTFICHSCGVMLDRDLNAARNLENAESFPASGRGAEIRPGGVDRPAAAEKRQKTATGDNHRLSSIGIGS